MGVPEMVVALDDMEKDSAYDTLSFDDRLKTAIDIAHQEQENAKVRRLITRAHFRLPQADIANIIYEGRPLDRQLISNLATARFVDNATDIVLEGVTGTGKSHLACALGKQACKRGLSTAYVRMPNLFEERVVSMAAGKAESKLVSKYARYKALIMDEWLIDPLSNEQMRFMLELVERRFDCTSTIFCSQYPREDWHRRLGGGVHADAVMDRIVHNVTVMKMGDVNMRELTTTKPR